MLFSSFASRQKTNPFLIDCSNFLFINTQLYRLQVNYSFLIKCKEPNYLTFAFRNILNCKTYQNLVYKYLPSMITLRNSEKSHMSISKDSLMDRLKVEWMEID